MIKSSLAALLFIILPTKEIKTLKFSDELDLKANAESGKLTIYTTAQNTKHRLSQTEVLTFKDFGQPSETQPCVFVDTSNTFQTFLGIGGAITDASAESFCQASKS